MKKKSKKLTLFVSLKFFVMSAFSCKPKTSGVGVNGMDNITSRLLTRFGSNGTE